MSDLAAINTSNTDELTSEIINEDGLLVDPFEDNPRHLADPQLPVFFMGANRRVVLDEVLHQCQFGNNLVAVLGETGVGKTSLIEQAVVELSETAQCCFVQASVMETMESIFRQVINQLNIYSPDSSSAGDMLAAIRQYHPEGVAQRIVIIIDDAHHLNDQILAAIVSLLQGQQAYLLHVLLAGDPSLAARLDKFEMVDVLISDLSLLPLSTSELREYLEFKLSSSGYQGEEMFNDKAVESIWRETQGLPAAINLSARNIFAQHIAKKDRLLNDAGVDSAEFGLPIWHMIIVVFLLAALIMALFYMGGDDESIQAEADAVEVIGSKAPVVSENDKESVAIDSVINEPVQEVVGDISVKKNSDAKSEDTIQKSSLKKDAESQEAKQVGEKIKDSVEKNDTAASPPKIVVGQKVDGVAITSVDENLKPAKKGVSSSAETPSSAGPEESVGSVDVVEGIGSVAKPSLPSVSTITSVSLDERAVLRWPVDDFTLQVMAASQKASLEKFVSAQPNNELLRIVGVLRNEKPWYIVLVGVYSSSEEAREAAQLLPQAQVNAGPWPRKIADIRSDIESFRRQ